jgi:hypothetical protein
LPWPIAESAKDLVKANHYYIKIAVPMEYQERLKALGEKLGFKKAPVATAARVIALLGALHPVEVEAWLDDMTEETADVIRCTAAYTGCNPTLN